MNNLMRYGAGARQYAEAAMYPGLFPARIILQHRDMYRIATEKGECFAEVSGKFRFEAAVPADFPAVGDYVMVDRETDETGNAIIHHVLRRKTVFARTDVSNQWQEQIIAANIDTVFICMSLNSNYNPSRLERYLSVAWASGALPAVVLTKADLCPNLSAVLAEISALAPAADVFSVSALDAASVSQLSPYLTPGSTVSFIGSSGVGKSTLINLLCGEETLRTAEIRSDGKGRHTTTRREMLVLPSGCIVVDTPGMRELGAEDVNLSKSFSDIDELISRCRFHDCTHEGEPGCAVSAAIAAGELDQRRFENYKKLKREAKYDGLDARALEAEKFSSMFSDVGGMKKVRKYIRENDKRRRNK